MTVKAVKISCADFAACKSRKALSPPSMQLKSNSVTVSAGDCRKSNQPIFRNTRVNKPNLDWTAKAKAYKTGATKAQGSKVK